MSIINAITYNNEKHDLGVSWDNVDGKPQTYPPGVHQHNMSDVQGLSAALSGKAAADHTHTAFADGLTIGQLRYQDNRVANMNDSGNLDFLLGSYQYGYYLDRNHQNNTWQRILAEQSSGNDYIKLSNGLALCWGKFDYVGRTDVDVPFPIQFANADACIMVSVGGLVSGTDATRDAFVVKDSVTNSKFGFYRYATGNCVVYWFAIGKWK